MAQGGQAAPLLGGNAAGGGCWDRFVAGLVAARRVVWDGRTGYERTAIVAGGIVLTTGAVVGGVCGTGHCGSATPGSGPHHSAANATLVAGNTSAPGGYYGEIRFGCSVGTKSDGSTPAWPNATVQLDAPMGVYFVNASAFNPQEISFPVTPGEGCEGVAYAGSLFPGNYSISLKLVGMAPNETAVLASNVSGLQVGPYAPLALIGGGDVPPARNVSLDERTPARPTGYSLSFNGIPPLLGAKAPIFETAQMSIDVTAEGTQLSPVGIGDTIYELKGNGTRSFTFGIGSSSATELAKAISNQGVYILSHDPYWKPVPPANMTLTFSIRNEDDISVTTVGSERVARVPFEGGAAPWVIEHITNGKPGPGPSPSPSPKPAQPVGFNGTLAASGLASGETGHPAAAGNLSVYGLDGRNATLRLVGAAADAVTGDVTFALMAANGTVVNCTLQQGAAAGSSCAVELPGVPAASVDAVTSRLALVGSDNARRNKGSISFSVTAEGTGPDRTASIAAPWNVSAAPALPRLLLEGGPFVAKGADLSPLSSFSSATLRVVNGTLPKNSQVMVLFTAAAGPDAERSFLMRAAGKSAGSTGGKVALPALAFSDTAAAQAGIRSELLVGGAADIAGSYQIDGSAWVVTEYRDGARGNFTGRADYLDCPAVTVSKPGAGSAGVGGTAKMCDGLELTQSAGPTDAHFDVAATIPSAANWFKRRCPEGWTVTGFVCTGHNITSAAARSALAGGLTAEPGPDSKPGSFPVAVVFTPVDGGAGCPADREPAACTAGVS